ncbi:hypothetical protein B0E33_01280 [Roseibium algicola]|uniref:Uncharacterized protein n=1 Tax=Roseibium algicola TaxID=2857014 RepID=A0ABM6HWF5_9HYPH|nr:hypothetical protein [Roseibium aggregatum]AQQ02387.1 hypothetical protein B0E33_01280 [Roseibium aggregatum]
MKAAADRMREDIDRMFTQALYGTTVAEPQEQEPFTLDKLNRIIDDLTRGLPPAPPKIQFAPDYIFPQDHYADGVAIIPHHPLHRKVSKFLDPEADTATVMRDGAMTRPDGTCFQFEDTVYVPNSFRNKFEK